MSEEDYMGVKEYVLEKYPNASEEQIVACRKLIRKLFDKGGDVYLAALEMARTVTCDHKAIELHKEVIKEWETNTGKVWEDGDD